MRGKSVPKFLTILFSISLVFVLSVVFMTTPVLADTSEFAFKVEEDGSVTITDYQGPGGSVVIPDYIDGKPVRTIGAEAFSNKASISAITIGNNVKVIRSYAFYKCDNLVSVSLPQSLTNIWDYAFARCGNLTSILIPTGLKEIGTANFSDDTALKQINVEAGKLIHPALQEMKL